MPSIHVLIATIGRESLINMLHSFLPSLEVGDHVTIVFDGKTSLDAVHMNALLDEEAASKAKVHVFYEEQTLGFWGHAIRNKYGPLLEKTDFVMHADDDDVYTDGAFQKIKSLCTDASVLYVAKMLIVNHKIVPTRNIIANSDIGTPCGIIPYKANAEGKWEYCYGGDFLFYDAVQHKCSRVEFIDHIIYTYNCRFFL